MVCSEYSSVSPILKSEKILSPGTQILLSKVKQSLPFFIATFFSCHPSSLLTYWFTGRASKNSFAIIICGSIPKSLISDIHFTVLFLRFSFCKFISLSDFSKIVMTGSILLSVTLQIVLMASFKSVPLPDPSSVIHKRFLFMNCW